MCTNSVKDFKDYHHDLEFNIAFGEESESWGEYQYDEP